RPRDRDVVQRHDSGQSRDAGDEIPELVITAGQPDLDRQLGVEVPLDLAEGLEQLLLETRAEPRLGDIDQQARHLRLARKLPEHRAERALDLGELLLVGVEVGGLALLLVERRAKLLLLELRSLEDGQLGLDDELPDTESDDERERDHDRADPERQRPAAGVVRVEGSKLLEEVHGASPRCSAIGTCCAYKVKRELRPGPASRVSMTSSAGSRSQSESSMLRMNAETRVLDCASPLISMRWPVCRTSVRRTPSGTVATSSPKRCTTSGRERWS